MPRSGSTRSDRSGDLPELTCEEHAVATDRQLTPALLELRALLAAGLIDDADFSHHEQELLAMPKVLQSTPRREVQQIVAEFKSLRKVRYRMAALFACALNP